MSRIIAIVVVVLAGIVAAGPSQAFFESKVEKAQKLIRVERYEDALRLLDEAVLDDPTNPATHFEVGKAYLGMGRDAAAEKTFSVLVRKLDPAYGVKVGKLYHEQGDWRREVQFDPSRKAATAKDLFTRAKAALRSGDLDGGARTLRAAVTLDSTLATEASSYLVELGDNAVAMTAQNERSGKSRADSLVYYRLAYNLLSDDDEEQREAIGLKVLDAAQKKKGKRGDSLKSEAERMLGKDHPRYVEAFPPLTWKTVFRGEYIGKGMGPKEYVKTAQGDKDVFSGYKVKILGERYKVWYKGGWKEYTYANPCEYIDQGSGGGYILVRAPAGENFIVEVQQLK